MANRLTFSEPFKTADPVTITSGGWFLATFQDGGAVTLVSDRFNVEAAWECCAYSTTFTPGSVRDMSTSTTAAGTIFAHGSVDGVDYPQIGRTPSSGLTRPMAQAA